MLEITIYDGGHRDNAAARALVTQYQRARPELLVHTTVCSSAEELLSLSGPRIYLLDVLLPDMDGLEAARIVRERNQGSTVIFLTASRRLALEAYRVRALNYLPKPTTEEELFDALDEAAALMERQREERFQIKSPTGILWLQLTQIVYLRPNQHVVELILQDGTQTCTQNLRVSFSQFVEPLLRSGRFVRPHHSYVVNTAYIDHLTTEALHLLDGTPIPVSHNKYQSMKVLFRS